MISKPAYAGKMDFFDKLNRLRNKRRRFFVLYAIKPHKNKR